MKTALIADDELITRMAFTKMAESMGFESVGSASDGFDAVELCRKYHPDIILMDLNMPVFDGMSAAERIIHEKMAGCVIIITAYGDESIVQRAAQAGVHGYLVKPVSSAALFSAVQVGMAAAERESRLLKQVSELEARLEENKLADRAKAALSEKNHISESEAYRQMQKLAMEKRCSIGDIARRLLEDDTERNLSAQAKQYLMEAFNLSEKQAWKRLNLLAAENGCSASEAAKMILTKKGRS